MIRAIIFSLYLPCFDILLHTVQKFGAAVENIPHNSIIEKILPNRGDMDFAKYKVGIYNL